MTKYPKSPSPQILSAVSVQNGLNPQLLFENVNGGAAAEKPEGPRPEYE